MILIINTNFYTKKCANIIKIHPPLENSFPSIFQMSSIFHTLPPIILISATKRAYLSKSLQVLKYKNQFVTMCAVAYAPRKGSGKGEGRATRSVDAPTDAAVSRAGGNEEFVWTTDISQIWKFGPIRRPRIS